MRQNSCRGCGRMTFFSVELWILGMLFITMLIQFKMSQRAGTIFLEDQEQKQSYDEHLNGNHHRDDSDADSNPHKIMDDDFKELLEADQESKEETVLRFKVVELQKICNSLTSTNRRLINRVAALEDERENVKKQEIFVDEYSELNGQFTEVEDLISEYKKSLEQFQKNVLHDLKLKEETIEKLREQLQSSTAKAEDLRLQKQDIEKLNRQLETRNEGLILEIQNIEREKIDLEQKLSSRNHVGFGSSNNRRNYDTSYLDEELSSEVQAQYESLIDKLVQELEYERSIKKKMGEEIKRLTGQLRNSQKQIMEKNRKIYDIQMKMLRSSKAPSHSTNGSHRPSRFDTERYEGKATNSKTQRSAGNQLKTNNPFITFLILQLINGEVEADMSPENRKIIGHKITQFYQRKLSKQDFSNVLPQNLLVSNFAPKKPELAIVRKTGHSAYEDGQKTEQSLIWNLAFMLDNLFGQGQQVEAFADILELTGQMLEKRVANNRDSLQSIKRLLMV